MTGQNLNSLHKKWLSDNEELYNPINVKWTKLEASIKASPYFCFKLLF